MSTKEFLDWVEVGRLTLNMRSTIAVAGVLDWMKTRKPAAQPQSVSPGLLTSGAVSSCLQLLPPCLPQVMGGGLELWARYILPSPNCFCFVPAGKVTNTEIVQNKTKTIHIKQRKKRVWRDGFSLSIGERVWEEYRVSIWVQGRESGRNTEWASGANGSGQDLPSDLSSCRRLFFYSDFFLRFCFLRCICAAHVMVGENQPPQVVLWPPTYMPWYMPIPDKINKEIEFNV